MAESTTDQVFHTICKLMLESGGAPPSVAEIAKELGKGLATIQHHIDALKADGRIERGPWASSRSIHVPGSAYTIPTNILRGIPFGTMRLVYWVNAVRPKIQVLPVYPARPEPPEGVLGFDNARSLVDYILRHDTGVQLSRTCVVTDDNDVILAAASAGLYVYTPAMVAGVNDG